MNAKRGLVHLSVLLGLCCISAVAGAAGMQALDDAALSDIRGRDGVSMLVNLNTQIGAHTVVTSDPTASISLNNLVVTGVIASTLDMVKANIPSLPDVVNIGYSDSSVLAGVNMLQVAYDMVVHSNGVDLGTSMVFQDVAFGGSSVQFTTARTTDGLVFGLGLKLDIGNILFRPNGRADTAGQQLSITGLKIADATNSALAWKIADINSQPGGFNVTTNAGVTNYEFLIDWPTPPANAPMGSLQIGNVTFNNTPTGAVNLGSSSIGSMQIQYLNVKFKS